MEAIKVIGLRSISYTGTTWINFVLASHPKGFYLGPPDRVWKLATEQHSWACLIHRPHCRFWESFFADYDQESRFLPQLKRCIGDKIIYIANPTAKFREAELSTEDVDFKEIFVQRDGRATLFSLMRHVPQTYPDFVTGLKSWLFPAMRIIHAASRALKDKSIIVRYEDFVADPMAELRRQRGFLARDYDESSLSYWDCEHHPTAGNIGTIDVLARMQGAADIVHHRKDHYDEVFKQAKAEPKKPVLDLGWLDHITREDRLAFDALLGPAHAYFGYERDKFEEAERQACAEALGFAALKGYPFLS